MITRLSTGVLLAVALLALEVFAQASAPQQAQPPSIDEVLATYRSDLQTNRHDVIARSVTLTPDQASRFWPIFEQYQREQSALMDEQMRGIQSYISAGDLVDDATALRFINAHLDRDANMAELRKRWLSEFQLVLPVKLAVRVMQIDRRISLAHQTQFTSQIPLVK